MANGSPCESRSYVRARRHTYLDELRVGLALLAEVTDGFEDHTTLRVGQLVAEREQHLGGLVDLVVDKPPVRVQLPEPLATRQGRREKAQTGTLVKKDTGFRMRKRRGWPCALPITGK